MSQSKPFGNFQKRKFTSPKKSFYNRSPRKKNLSPTKNDVSPINDKKSQTSMLHYYSSPNSETKRAKLSEEAKNHVKKSLFSDSTDIISLCDSDNDDIQKLLPINSPSNTKAISNPEKSKTVDDNIHNLKQVSPTKSNLSIEEANSLLSDIDWWDDSSFAEEQITKSSCSTMSSCEKNAQEDKENNANLGYDGQDNRTTPNKGSNLQNDSKESTSTFKKEEQSLNSSKEKKISTSKAENVKEPNSQSADKKIETDLLDYIINTPPALLAWKTIFSHSIYQNIYRNYMSLPFEEKRLYSRLYCRKYDWIRLENIKYDFISDIKMSLTNLNTIGFIKFLDPKDEDLSLSLNLLQLDEIKKACDKISVNKTGKKSILINNILKRVKSQTTLKFGNVTPMNKMVQQIIKDFPTFIKLEEEPRNLFTSFLIISTYPQTKSRDDSRTSIVVDLLFKLYNGTVRELGMTLSPIQLFKTLAKFKDYEQSVKLVDELLEAKKDKNWDQAAQLVLRAKTELQLYLGNKENISELEEMFDFTKKYTPGSNYVYAINEGIDVLKKQKGEAADSETEECLRLLLSQHYFKKGRRAFWNYELALLMERSKKYEEAFLTLKQGLLEESITSIGKVLLSDRCKLLIKKKKGISDLQKEKLKELIKEQSYNYKKSNITAEAMPNINNKKQTWRKQTNEGNEYMSVEELARQHYSSDLGGSYTEGYHDEGRIILNIALCTFWEVIYEPIDGMFHVRLQDRPIDWGSSAFYHNRADLIKKHKERLMNIGTDGIMKEINQVCNNHFGTISVVSWELIKLENMKNIEKFIECVGAKPFLDFCDYLLKAYKERSSGLPDLTLWNVSNKKALFVEVKGPTDKLSQKQIVWLEKLNEFGIQAEVCHVNTPHTGKREIYNEVK